MTNQEKIQHLRRYQSAGLEIERLEEEITIWRSRAEKTTTLLSKAPARGKGDDQLQGAVVTIDRLITKLADKQKTLAEMRISIEQSITSVPDERLQLLLRYRYLNGYTWEKIAVVMDLTYRWVCELHGQAVEKIFISI